MNICMEDLRSQQSAKKRSERTRARQFAELPLSFESLVLELGSSLLMIRQPSDLARISETSAPRLSRRDHERFVQFVADRFGMPFARRAGLPVGPPSLRLAG